MQPLTFPIALREASVLLDRLQSAKEAERAAFKAEIDRFMQSEESCRGFFVVLLTDERTIADEPPVVLIESIARAGQIPSSVLVRNLVMSAATRLVHERQANSQDAAGSEQVMRRTQNLIRKIDSDSVSQNLAAMRATLAGDSDDFAAFLARVNYDDEQKQVALKAIDEL